MYSRIGIVITYVVMTAFSVAFIALPYLLYPERNLLPAGWDTPFYLWKSRIATEVGVAATVAAHAPRLGYTTFLSLFAAAGIENIFLAQKIAGTFITYLLLLANALFCYLVFSRKQLAFWLAFLIGITNFAFLRLAEDLYDNSFALMIAVLILSLVFVRFYSRLSQPMVIGLLFLVISLTHLESGLFLAIALGLYLLSTIRDRSRKEIFLTISACVVLAGLIIVAWGEKFVEVLSTYPLNPNTTAILAKFQALNGTRAAEFFGSTWGYGFVTVSTVAFTLFAVVALLKSVRDSDGQERSYRMLFAWLAATLSLLMINAILFSFSIPNNRIVLFLPFIPFLVGLLIFIRDKTNWFLLRPAWVVVAALLLIPNSVQAFEYRSSRTSFLQPATQDALISLSNDWPNEQFSFYTREDYKEAYYGQWQNWLWAVGPINEIKKPNAVVGEVNKTLKANASLRGKTIILKEFNRYDYGTYVMAGRNIASSTYLLDEDNIVSSELVNFEHEQWQPIRGNNGMLSFNIDSSESVQSNTVLKPKDLSAADALEVMIRSSHPENIKLVEISLINDNDNFAYFPVASTDITINDKKLILPVQQKGYLGRIVRIKIDVTTTGPTSVYFDSVRVIDFMGRGQ